MSEITNTQKYENYRSQMGRLNRAIKEHFLLEAMFIEAAIIEDRCESLLKHSNAFNPAKHTSMDRILARLKEMARNKSGLLQKYITVELLDEIYAWKKERNRLTHALMKQQLTGEEMMGIVEQGQAIIKKLCSKTTSYNRALQRQAAKEQQDSTSQA